MILMGKRRNGMWCVQATKFGPGNSMKFVMISGTNLKMVLQEIDREMTR
jgi:hypothetical protein